MWNIQKHTQTNCVCVCGFFQRHLLLLANSVLTVCKIPRKLVANTELLTSFLFMRKTLMGVVAKGQGAGEESCCINFWLEFICLSSEVDLMVNGIERFKLRRGPTVSCVCVLESRGLFSLFSSHWCQTPLVEVYALQSLRAATLLLPFVYTRMNVQQTTVGTRSLGWFWFQSCNFTFAQMCVHTWTCWCIFLKLWLPSAPAGSQLGLCVTSSSSPRPAQLLWHPQIQRQVSLSVHPHSLRSIISI